MGLGGAFLSELIELKHSGALDGARCVMEIGDQQLADSLLTSPALTEAYRLFGCVSPPAFSLAGKDNFSNSAPPSTTFWNALGFERSAIDVVGDAIRLDLNCDRVPRSLRGKFDLIVNAGTTEHVANQLNAFTIIHDLCRPGGVMYHEVPAGGMIDHGLISYEPKFFNLLCKANNYEPLFIRYRAESKSSIPEYLQNERIRFDIAECVLSVALRKIGDSPFLGPVDAPEHERSRRTGISTIFARWRRLTQSFS